MTILIDLVLKQAVERNKMTLKWDLFPGAIGNCTRGYCPESAVSRLTSTVAFLPAIVFPLAMICSGTCSPSGLGTSCLALVWLLSSLELRSSSTVFCRLVDFFLLAKGLLDDEMFPEALLINFS